MKKVIQINNVFYTYSKEKSNLSNINVCIKKGECVVLCGKSGCGKTTLLRMINGLIPHFYEGNLQGEVKVAGMDVKTNHLQQLSKVVGSVFQNPRSQFFHMDTTGEIAFNLENQGMDRRTMQERVAGTIQTLNLQHLIDRNIFELSGGEKQRIACGAVYAVFPEIVVFDEPSSNLDMDSIRCLKDIITQMKRAGKTIVISEHRLWYLWGIADRYLYLEAGTIKGDFSPIEMNELSVYQRTQMGLRALKEQEIMAIGSDKECGETLPTEGIRIEKMLCTRGKKKVLDIEKLFFPKGAIVAVIGQNGAGKSTFCMSLAGLLKAKSNIEADGKKLKRKDLVSNSYVVMQEAGHQLFCDSVREELQLGQDGLTDEMLAETLTKLNILELEKKHPGSLSDGQKQRVAMATALCAKREIMLYDEPTSGQDGENLLRTVDVIQTLNEQAKISLVVTHDPEFILHCATHILHIQDGKVKDFKELDEEGISYMWKVLNERK